MNSPFDASRQPAPAQPEKRDRVTDLRVIPVQPKAEADIANLAAEAAVIGAVLKDPPCFPMLREQLQPGDFYGKLNGFIWLAFGALGDQRSGIDQVTVLGELRQHRDKYFSDHLADFDLWIAQNLTVLQAKAPDIRNVERYANDVRTAALNLRLYQAGAEIMGKALDRAIMPDVKVETVNRITFKATEQVMSRKSHISAAAEQHRTAMLARRGLPASPATPTGFTDLDEKIGGLYPGEVCILGGDSGLGKTSFLLSVNQNVAKWGGGIFHATGEVQRDEIIGRFVTMATGIPSRAMRNGDLTDAQFEVYDHALDKIVGWQYHIMDEYERFTVSQMRTKMYRILNEGGTIDLIVADGIWLMDSNDPTLPRFQGVTEILGGLRKLAREFNCPVIGVQQYREGFRTKDNIPTQLSFAESSAVRRDAHLMLALHRLSYYDSNAVDENGTQLYILKYRGESGVQGSYINMNYDMRRSMYHGFNDADYAPLSLNDEYHGGQLDQGSEQITDIPF